MYESGVHGRRRLGQTGALVRIGPEQRGGGTTTRSQFPERSAAKLRNLKKTTDAADYYTRPSKCSHARTIELWHILPASPSGRIKRLQRFALVKGGDIVLLVPVPE